jgi:dipeptidyl aminopeptidase/acylaminoacyl peptidase
MARAAPGLALTVMLVLALSACGSGPGSAPKKSVRSADFRSAGGAHAELRPPANGESPHGLLVLIHGGAWKGADPTQFKAAQAVAGGYQRLGYATLAIEYRAGAAGLADIEHFYDLARRKVGSKLPICAVGSSAGGHLALMLAVRRSSLACVISLAGPTDLLSLGKGGGQLSQTVAVQRFGADHLRDLSPALHADRIHARLLLAYATNDPYVPASQGTELAKRKPGSRLVILTPGHQLFVHSYVDPDKIAALNRLELQFLAQNTR